MEKTPEEILNENDVWINHENPTMRGWVFEHKGKRIPQPEPWKCYETLIREFGITEPRLKNWR